MRRFFLILILSYSTISLGELSGGGGRDIAEIMKEFTAAKNHVLVITTDENKRVTQRLVEDAAKAKFARLRYGLSCEFHKNIPGKSVMFRNPLGLFNGDVTSPGAPQYMKCKISRQGKPGRLCSVNHIRCEHKTLPITLEVKGTLAYTTTDKTCEKLTAHEIVQQWLSIDNKN